MLSLLLALACGASVEEGLPAPAQLGPPSANAAPTNTPTFPTTVEVTLGQPTGQEHLVVGLHGRGAHPQRFQHLLDGATGSYRALFPLAPTPYGDGGTWFTVSTRDNTPDLLAMDIARAADQVAAWIAQESPTGQAVVFGFSQGGMLSMALAAYHPERVVGVVAMGGMWPDPRPPMAGERKPSVLILHGEADDIVPAAGAVQAELRFKEAGYPVESQLWPGVKHSVPPEMRARLQARVVELVGSE